MDEFRFFLRGQIDTVNAADLARCLYRVGVVHRGDLVIDCTELELIGLAGFRALTTLASDFVAGGRSLRLANPIPNLTKMVRVFGAGALLVEPAYPVTSGQVVRPPPEKRAHAEDGQLSPVRSRSRHQPVAASTWSSVAGFVSLPGSVGSCAAVRADFQWDPSEL